MKLLKGALLALLVSLLLGLAIGTALRLRLERSVYYDRLAPESVELLRTLAEQVGVEALQQVNRRALSLQADDQGRPDATRRVNFGIYHFDEDEAGDGSHESGDG